MPPSPAHPGANLWLDAEGTPVPLYSRVEQVVVNPQHGALRCQLHQPGRVISRGTTLLFIRLDQGNRLIALPPHLVRVLDTPDGD